MSDHFTNQLRRCNSSRHVSGHAPPIAEHRRACAYPANLIHPVADINDAHAFSLQPADVIEQVIDFRVGQRRGRFVQYQQPTVLGERSGDFYELLLPNPELVGWGRRVQILQANPGQGFGRHLFQSAKPDETGAVRQAA